MQCSAVQKDKSGRTELRKEVTSLLKVAGAQDSVWRSEMGLLVQGGEPGSVRAVLQYNLSTAVLFSLQEGDLSCLRLSFQPLQHRLGNQQHSKQLAGLT